METTSVPTRKTQMAEFRVVPMPIGRTLVLLV